MNEKLTHNFLLLSDSYKHSVIGMWPEGTEYVSSYYESRGGKFPSTVFFGLQAYLKEYLSKPITMEDIDAAEGPLTAIGAQFDRQVWVDLVNDHGGYLPLEIEAIPEGTVVPTKNVLFQVINTDPKYAWLPNYIETPLQRALWYPTSVATMSWVVKQHLREVLERTTGTSEGIRSYLHNYGTRAATSVESSDLGAMAHLVNFGMTEIVGGYLAAQEYYGEANAPGGASWFLDHSVTTTRGVENEADTFRFMMEGHPTLGSNGLAGFLTDTFDHDHAVRNIIGTELKAEVLSYPGLVAVRIDSGDPVKMPADTVEVLMETLGHSVNEKGFKVLPPNVKVVQGDGLDAFTFPALYDELERRGLAADNVLCGMGGGLMQDVARDTLNFGYKANAIRVNGTWKDAAKRPKGSIMKHSKGGRLALQSVDGGYKTVRRETITPEENLMVPVYRNGEMLNTSTFAEVIARSEQPTPQWYYDMSGATQA